MTEKRIDELDALAAATALAPATTVMPLRHISGAATYKGTIDRIRGTGIISVTDLGAVGDGSIDDTSAINTASTAAASAGALLVFPAGKTFKVTSKVTIKGPCLGTGATINVHGNPAIAVECSTGNASDPTTLLSSTRFDLPALVNMSKPGTGWSGTGVGYRLHNLKACVISIPYVEGFGTGVLESSKSQGTVGNQVHLGWIVDNLVGLHLSPLTDGWNNENNYFGGYFQHSSGEGSGVSGCRHVKIDRGSTSNGGPNNNRFRGIAFENDAAEYYVDIEDATNNLFDWCRWEGSTPAVNIDHGATVGGAGNNRFVGGYGLSLVTFTITSSAGNTYVQDEGGNLSLVVGSGFGLSNSSSSASPVFRIWDAGESPIGKAVDAADWSVFLSAQQLAGKLLADTFPRLSMQFATGRVEFGNGSALQGRYRVMSGGIWQDTGMLWVDNTVTAQKLSLNNGSAENAQWTSGNGSPEAAVTAPKGSLYSQLNASDGTSCLWAKCTGTGNTGWKLVTVP